ncbi:MAG: hypothetical protein ACREND_09655 [Gemmatimonadaceae bacterium]
MSISRGHLARISGLAALVIGVPMLSPAFAQSPTADASTLKLKTQTTADKTATVGVPDGWTLTKGANGYVGITGPNDERINLGAIIIAKDAPAATRNPGGEVAFVMPFNASLKEKFTTIVQTGAAQQGMPKPEIAFASEVPTKLPMCSRLLGSSTAGADARKFEGIVCSLQPDWQGFYKNIVFILEVPSSRAAAARPIVEAIAASYRVTPDMFKKMLAPYTALPPRPSGGTAPAVPGLAPYQDPTNSDCFDYNVIRASPPWEVPMHCGGTKPG